MPGTALSEKYGASAEVIESRARFMAEYDWQWAQLPPHEQDAIRFDPFCPESDRLLACVRGITDGVVSYRNCNGRVAVSCPSP